MHEICGEFGSSPIHVKRTQQMESVVKVQVFAKFVWDFIRTFCFPYFGSCEYLGELIDS